MCRAFGGADKILDVYDELDRLVKEVNYQGHEKTYQLDANGNLIAQVDFNGNRTTYSYDRLNRLVETLFADGSKKEFAYDELGNLTKAVNSAVEERFHYDKLSRLVRAETIGLFNTENKVVEFNYDKVGNTTAVITYEGDGTRATNYLYDELNRLSRVTLPDGGTVEFKYDALNRIVERINANETRTVYTYTPRSELESIVNYQGRGHWQKVLSAYGYLYNAKGQRIYQIEGDGDLTAYRYDPVGRLTEVYYPFTDKKKIADLKERQSYGLVPHWEGPKEFKVTRLNLSWEEERNLGEQLTELNNLLFGNGKGKKDDYYLNPGTNGLPFVNHLMVDYKDQGKLEGLYRRIQPWGMGLNLWSKGYWKEQFTYDPNGNVINKRNGWGEINYTYNANNQLLRAGNRTYQYDLNGNLIREELGAFYAEYEYSTENRLITARNNSPFIYPDWNFTGEINYAYDALGRKVSKKVSPWPGNKGNIEYYLYAGLGTDIIAQYELEIHNNKGKGKGKGNNPHDPAGELTQIQEYYYGNGFLLAAKTIDKPSKPGFGWGFGFGWGHNPLKDVTFYHQDVLGSVVMLTGQNGQVVERYEYDAYGAAYNGKFEHGLAGMGGNPYGFTGKRYEPELGIYSFAFRDYNSQSMRWMTEDPIKDGLNWYQYCGSDPVNWVDLLGLLCGETVEKVWTAVPDPFAKVEFSVYANQGSMTFIGDENISIPAFGSTTIRIDGTVGVTINDDDTTRMVVDIDITAYTGTSWSPVTDVEMKIGLSAKVTVRDDAGTPGNIFDDTIKNRIVSLGKLDVNHGLESGVNNITASTIMHIENESIIDIQPDRLTVSVELTVGFAPVGAPTFSRGQTVTGNVATIILDEPGGADTNQVIAVSF